MIQETLTIFHNFFLNVSHGEWIKQLSSKKISIQIKPRVILPQSPSFINEFL